MCSQVPKRLMATGLTLCLLCFGCGYPEVSPKTYEIAKALYSISNLKRTNGLDKVETLIAESLAAGEISDRESGFLTEIVQHGRNGEWDWAQKESRRLMEDQVNR